MIPKLLCGSCGHDLAINDRYCGNCGTEVTLGKGTDDERGASATPVCGLCGSENPQGSKYCAVCGAALTSGGRNVQTRQDLGGRKKEKESERSNHSKRKVERQSARIGTSLAGWKIVALVGGILLLALVVIGLMRNRPVNLPTGTPTTGISNPNIVQDIEQQRKIVDANPTNSSAVLKLANLLHDGKFTDQAIVYYKKYLALNEKDPDARVDLGICYFELGDRKAAIAEMEKALTYSPRHQLGHFNLGIVNLAGGDTKTAIEWFRKSIALSPETETARRAQEMINQHSTINTP